MAKIKRIFIDKTSNKKYEPVEYIKTGDVSSTSEPNAYIELDYRANPKTAWELDIKYVDYTNNANVQGHIPGGTSMRFEITSYQSKWYITCGSSHSLSAADNNRHKFKTDSFNKKIYIDGVAQSVTVTGLANTQSSPLPIGARKATSEYNGYCAEYVYGSKVWESNELVIDLIPVREISTKEYGLFDKVNNKFYGTKSAVAFTGGNVVEEINSPIHIDSTSKKIYKEVEYIQTDGQAYIDSGIIPTENTRIVQDMEYKSFGTMTNIGIFGQYSANGSVTRAFLDSNRAVRVQWKGGYPTLTYIAQIGKRLVADMDGKSKQFKIDGTSLYSLPTGSISAVNRMAFLTSLCPDTQWLGDFVANLYSGQLYQDGTNITLDLVPVKEVGTTTYGMFDKVSNKFYGNANTTGAFTGGDETGIVYTDARTQEQYRKVEYIQSSGTQYIDLDYKPNNNTIWDTDFQLTGDYPISTQQMSGVLASNGRFAWGTYQSKWGVMMSTTFYSTIDADLNRHIIRLDAPNGTAYLDGTLIKSGMAKQIPSQNIYLALRHQPAGTNDSPMASKFYGSKITEGGTVIKDFIAVKNITTGEYGMFDRVNNKFYGNNGTGTFTGGEFIKYYGNIEIPVRRIYKDATTNAKYEKVEYIQSSGTQYIDTGTKLSNNTKVDLKLLFTTTTYTGTAIKIFGSRGGADVNNISVASGISSGKATQATLDFNNSAYATYRTARNIAANTIYNLVLAKEERSVNGEGNFVVCPDTIQTPANAYIFNVNGSAYGDKLFVGRVYGCSFLENTTFIRDFIPVRNIITGEYGLFDKVNNKFYGNAGTGDFTGGSAVKEKAKVKLMRRVRDNKTLIFEI